MTARRSLITDQLAASCYFRTSVPTGQRKALVQVTERCNLHCAHCFVSAGDYGDTMRTADIAELLIPRLGDCRVSRVTLTGGEPFAHPDIVEIAATFRAHGFGVGICSNATIISDAQLAALADIGGVHVNVSLDGFRAESHGRFRGNRASFHTTIDTVCKLARAGLLQGLLCTPKQPRRGRRVRRAVRVRGRQRRGVCAVEPAVLDGPRRQGPRAARRGRGAHAAHLRPDRPVRRRRAGRGPHPLPQHHQAAGAVRGRHDRLRVHPRRADRLPLPGVRRQAPQSRHDPAEFIVGNIFADPDIAARLDAYRFHERYQVGANPTCQGCSLETACGKGCPAAVVSAGERIGSVDAEVCPVTTAERRLLPLLPIASA